jgi:hypothetical protein
VYSVDGKAHLAIEEAAGLKVKPALWIALVGSTLRVHCSPYAVVIICSAFHLSHISGIEDAVEEYAGLSGLGEVEFGALGDKGWIWL